MKFYVSFGQAHTHSVGSQVVDKDCIVEIEAPTIDSARGQAFHLFGNKFSRIKPSNGRFPLHLYPRGVIKIS